MSWFSRIFRRRGIYADYSEELRSHLEERAEQLMRDDGISREEAEQRARRAFGNATLIEERGREAWQWPGIENLLRDLSYSARLLRRTPGFTAVALLTLTLGIGANMAVFSLLNGLLLKPLPVPEANRLVLFKLNGDQLKYSFCAPLLRALEKRHEVFSDVFGFSKRDLKYRDGSATARVESTLVSGQFFHAMGVAPELGRTLTPNDDRKDGHESGYPAVVSDGFWKTRLGQDPYVLGRHMILNDVTFTVVGVMPASFIGADPSQRPEIYVPITAESLIDAPFDGITGGASTWWIRMGARLQPGVSFAKADAAMGSISASAIAEAIPADVMIFKLTRSSMRILIEPGAGGFSMLRTEYRAPLMMIFALCLLVLVLACVNLASLLLARSTAREREIATRLAIGASRMRLVQQLMADSLLLAVLGGAAGLAVAPLAGHSLVHLFARKGVHLDASLDWRVAAFAVGCALVSTLLVGLLPAFQATAGDLMQHMKDGAKGTGKRERSSLLPKVLLTFEVALAMVLVTGAGLLGTSLYRMVHTGLGFNPHNLLEVTLSVDKQPLQGASLMHLYDEISARVAVLPGVRHVGYTNVPPLSGTMMMGTNRAPGGGDRDDYTNSIGPGYFAAMGTRILEGRDFQADELNGKNTNVLINQTAAQMFFPGQDALGKMLFSGTGKSESHQTIVGLVEDAKYALLNAPSPPMVYSPINADGAFKKPDFTLMVRYTGPVGPLAAAIRDVLRSVAPGVPVEEFNSMEEVVSEASQAQRATATLAGFFGVCALLVTGIGLYGVLAYATARRTSEIGIRMALGAARGNVIRLVFQENAWVAGAGCVAGLIAAVLSSKAIAIFLYGTSARDPWVLLAALAALCLIAFFASLLPALRAASVDPMRALRSE
ncbi:ADOP family duplicated permease [Silvibacterium sp.]|uniref:ABC transporter permease n=1 Tax=Silvibacterium sp. TaxID=1964179 RepID=UPI0039E281ED